MNPVLSPAGILYLAAILTGPAALWVLVVGCRPGRKVLSRCLCIAAAGLLALPSAGIVHLFYPEVLDARFRTYKSFYRDIQVGMTRADVITLVELDYPLHGPRHRPITWTDTAEELDFFMHPEDSTEPNCEGIFLELKDGRVMAKSYCAD